MADSKDSDDIDAMIVAYTSRDPTDDMYPPQPPEEDPLSASEEEPIEAKETKMEGVEEKKEEKKEERKEEEKDDKEHGTLGETDIGTPWLSVHRANSLAVLPIKVIHKDIIRATEEYIVQQCNCSSLKPHGLSYTLARRFPDSNIYALRTGKKNRADPSSMGTPGDVVKTSRVICLLAQAEMGKPGVYNRTPYSDTKRDRETYFRMCLDKLGGLKPSSLAFPHGIGCGLGGGNWYAYDRMITEFSRKYDIPCTYYFYKK